MAERKISSSNAVFSFLYHSPCNSPFSNSPFSASKNSLYCINVSSAKSKAERLFFTAAKIHSLSAFNVAEACCKAEALFCTAAKTTSLLFFHCSSRNFKSEPFCFTFFKASCFSCMNSFRNSFNFSLCSMAERKLPSSNASFSFVQNLPSLCNSSFSALKNFSSCINVSSTNLKAEGLFFTAAKTMSLSSRHSLSRDSKLKSLFLNVSKASSFSFFFTNSLRRSFNFS